jgi:large subunit ribosomal protein L5
MKEKIWVEKVVLHCSTAEPAKLERCMKLLKFISGMNPVKTLAKKRIPAFKIRPGLEIGCKVTARKQRAIAVLKKIFAGFNTFDEDKFSEGYLSFGIKEYIEIPTLPYQREIGILGFEMVVNLTKGGKRVSERKHKRSKVGKKQRITKEETIQFFKNKFNITIEEE